MKGLPLHRLEDIELRLAGVDHRPWVLSQPVAVDDEGRRFVSKGSRKAMKKAIQAGARQAELMTGKVRSETPSEEWMCDRKTLEMSIALFHRTGNATDDMMEFIAHAPEDVEDLLREAKVMRIEREKLRTERDEAVKELTSTKVQLSRAESKITDMKRAWRTLNQEMK